jgi:hypothetical protein
MIAFAKKHMCCFAHALDIFDVILMCPKSPSAEFVRFTDDMIWTKVCVSETAVQSAVRAELCYYEKTFLGVQLQTATCR